jgi:putative transposase
MKKMLSQLAAQYPRYGYWKLYHLLRLQGHIVNHKRIYRLYKALGLTMRRKTKKRLPSISKQPLIASLHPNQTWSIDFMTDTTTSSRRFRTLNVIDDFNREGLMVEAAWSIPGLMLTRLLDKIAFKRGYPQSIRCDNGPELRSHTFNQWAKHHDIKLLFIQPGKPTQNAFIERFNGTYRREVLDAYLFRTLEDVQTITNKWLDEYNHIRPHAALGNVPPALFESNKSRNITFNSGNNLGG